MPWVYNEDRNCLAGSTLWWTRSCRGGEIPEDWSGARAENPVSRTRDIKEGPGTLESGSQWVEVWGSSSSGRVSQLGLEPQGPCWGSWVLVSMCGLLNRAYWLCWVSKEGVLWPLIWLPAERSTNPLIWSQGNRLSFDWPLKSYWKNSNQREPELCTVVITTLPDIVTLQIKSLELGSSSHWQYPNQEGWKWTPTEEEGSCLALYISLPPSSWWISYYWLCRQLPWGCDGSWSSTDIWVLSFLPPSPLTQLLPTSPSLFSLLFPSHPYLPLHRTNIPKMTYLRGHYGALFSSSASSSGSFLLTSPLYNTCPVKPSSASRYFPIYLLLSASPENWNWLKYMDAVGLYIVSNKTNLL